MWFLKKNRKGQAIVELAIVMNIMLLMFFAMILFSVYIYDKVVVSYATNLAINEAMGRAPEEDEFGIYIENDEIAESMKDVANGALNLGIFLVEPSVDTYVERLGADRAHFSVTVSAKYSIKLPLVSEFLNDNVITSTGEVDYIW